MANTVEVQERIRLDRIQKLKTYESTLKTRLSGGIPDKELKAFIERDLSKTQNRIKLLGG